MDYNVKNAIKEVDASRKNNVSANSKDEITIMHHMLNDKEFSVDIYGKTGKIGEYSPREDATTLASSILKNATGISSNEAKSLADNYEFSKNDSKCLVNLSKEYINTYMETGRKLPLGGRARSNISIAKKIKPEKITESEFKIGVNDDGSDKIEVREVKIPQHESLRVFSSAPCWLK